MSTGVTEALLLDTHVFLWASFAPQKLPEGVRRQIEDGRVALHVSVASLWEIEVKHHGGQLQADAKAVDASMRALGVKPVAVTAEHVRLAAQMRGQSGRDPFDWMIAAQAAAEGWPLVTGDESFGRFAGVEVRW